MDNKLTKDTPNPTYFSEYKHIEFVKKIFIEHCIIELTKIYKDIFTEISQQYKSIKPNIFTQDICIKNYKYFALGDFELFTILLSIMNLDGSYIYIIIEKNDEYNNSKFKIDVSKSKGIDLSLNTILDADILNLFVKKTILFTKTTNEM